jgi:hypothetical protein
MTTTIQKVVEYGAKVDPVVEKLLCSTGGTVRLGELLWIVPLGIFIFLEK